MKKIASIISAGALALVLGGCSITAQGVATSTDSTVNAFQNMCLALPSAHSNFLAIADAFNVKQSIRDTELKVYNAGVAFCSSGIVGDAAAAVKKAAAYVEQINAARQQASGG